MNLFTCAVCAQIVEARGPGQRVCSLECGAALAMQTRKAAHASEPPTPARKRNPSPYVSLTEIRRLRAMRGGRH